MEDKTGTSDAHLRLDLSRWREPDSLTIRMRKMGMGTQCISEWLDIESMAALTIRTEGGGVFATPYTVVYARTASGVPICHYQHKDGILPPEFVAFMDEHFRKEG